MAWTGKLKNLFEGIRLCDDVSSFNFSQKAFFAFEYFPLLLNCFNFFQKPSFYLFIQKIFFAKKSFDKENDLNC
jgi:hypothetical protein